MYTVPMLGGLILKKKYVFGGFFVLLVALCIVTCFTHVKPITKRQVQDILVEHKLLYPDTMDAYKINVDKHNRTIYIVENYTSSAQNLNHMPDIIGEANHRALYSKKKTPTEKKFWAASKELSQKYGRNWTMKIYDDVGEGSLNRPSTLSDKYLAWTFKGGQVKYDYINSHERKAKRAKQNILNIINTILNWLVSLLGLYILIKYPRECWSFVRGGWRATKAVGRGTWRIFNAGPDVTENTIYAGKPNINGGSVRPRRRKKRKSNTVHVYNDVDGTTNIHPDHSGGGYDDEGNWHKYDGDGHWE